MRKFLLKSLFFLLPILMLGFEALLPASTFTFRPFEALLYNHSGVGMPFYPNHKLEMMAEGDLCSYSEYAVKRNELWITDEIGYRNNRFIEDPDILLIGDSFNFGMGLSQDSTLTNLLTSKFDDELKIYNIAPASLSDFMVLFNNNILEKPKIIILVVGETIVPSLPDFNSGEEPFKNSKVSLWINKATRLYSIRYFMAKFLNSRLLGVQSEVNGEMFFLKGKSHDSNPENIESVAGTIQGYQNYCDSLGIGFIFIPIPDKETVYFDEIPVAKQDNYLFKLSAALEDRDIANINSLQVFNLQRQKSTALIYHLDDFHWNHNGANIMAEEIEREICTSPMKKYLDLP